MTSTEPNDQQLANQLAVLLHVSGGGTINNPGSGQGEFDALGQKYLDAATNKSSESDAETPGTGASTGTGDTASPVPEGTGVSGAYGEQRGGRAHGGIDLSVPLDTRLTAAQSGVVTVASNADPGGYGLYVEIKTDNGYTLRYGHMHSADVKVGQRVTAGQPIGTSGGEKGGANSGNSQGAHLHFEVRGPDGNSIDPSPWLAGGHSIASADPSEITVVNPDSQLGTTAMNVLDVAAGETPGRSAQTTTTKGKAGSSSDTDPNGVEAFLAATRKHESGGDYRIYNQSGLSNASGAYQFLGSTWQGLGGSTANAAEASPEEQDRIARAYALQLFKQFGSWRLVAIAWYGGPGIAQQVAAGGDPGAPDQQGSYLAYGNTIAQMMASGEGA